LRSCNIADRQLVIYLGGVNNRDNSRRQEAEHRYQDGEQHVIGDTNSCPEWLPEFVTRACLSGGRKTRPAGATLRRIIHVAC
jgi:hypothetical protein